MNHKLTRLLIIVVAVLAGTAVLHAQGSVSKKINAVKLSGECFYAESTDANEETAKANATTFLANYINEYLKDNELSVNPVTESSIPGIKYFSMDRSGNKRVFAYVEKAVILDGASPAPQPETVTEAPEQTPAPAPDVAGIPAPVQTPAVADQPYQEPIQVSEANLADAGDILGYLLWMYCGIPEETTRSMGYTPKNLPGDLTQKQKLMVKMLTNLDDSRDMKEAFLKTQRYNAEYIVKRYGPVTKCKNRMWSFWMIFSPDGTRFVSFLTPGNEGQRIDLVNRNEQASLNDFLGGGNNALFFELR